MLSMDDSQDVIRALPDLRTVCSTQNYIVIGTFPVTTSMCTPLQNKKHQIISNMSFHMYDGLPRHM